jgi:pimeloyl-ACP methyl ester carboxylesterase
VPGAGVDTRSLRGKSELSPLISQLEVAWEEPALEHFWSRFAACARVVMFDRRGAGLSDRSAEADHLGLAALAMDVKAVLDSSDTQRAVLFGVTLGSPIAVQLAVGYPDRAQALVLAGGFAKLTRLGGAAYVLTRIGRGVV